jgi:hypothetical protein
MARMRVLNCNKQSNQPSPKQDDDYRNEEEELVRFDVEYFVTCLSKDRKTDYEIICKQDDKNRQSPQPDYLIKNNKTGSLMAIEYARLFQSEKTRKREATLVKKLNGKSSTGVGVILQIQPPTPEELGRRLSEFVLEQLSKGQFRDCSQTERILLVRNRWSGAGIDRFLEAEPYFKLPKPVDCDHFFLIVSSRLLEVF